MQRSSFTLLRIMDANANRALEGLRVCEEIVRLHADSPRHFRAVRTLRHAVAAAIRRFPATTAARLAARRSGTDVGRRAPAERVASLEQLLLINFQRAKEALRVLEECARLDALRSAAAFQRLRFRTYQVEQHVLRNLASVRHPRSLRRRRP